MLATATTLADTLETYLAVRVKIRSTKTREHYRRSIRQFADYLQHEPTLADLHDDALAGFMLATVAAGYTETTANQRTKQIRALWNWCAKRRLVEHFPTFDDLDEPEPLPAAWNESQLQQLFAACARQRGWIGPHAASAWWLAIHWWWLCTAERTEATMLLERPMLELDKGMAVVPARIRKGKKKNRHYRLTPRCCELLEQILRVPSPTGLVFDHGWSNWRSIFKRYRQLVQSAGLPYVRGKTGPKKLRCTVYTQIELAGGDASKFARHSDRRVTESYIDQLMVGANAAGTWPPAGLNPETVKPGGWRSLFRFGR
jgi:integrase